MTRIFQLSRVLAVLVAVFLPLSALGVETTGALHGKVTDSSGTVLPGITVTVTGESLIGGARTAVTDDQGRFRFPALPVGNYTVKAEHEGFRTTESRTYVGIGSDITVDFALQLPTAEETFVITDVRPVVDPSKTESGATYDSDFLQNVPSGRSYQGMTSFVPGVTDAGSGNPNVHGETLYSNSYLLDGVNITDPVTHTFSTNFNFDAIEAIEIITGGYDPEYGQATGAIVNIVTKSGGNELEVDSSLYYQDYNLASGGKKSNGDYSAANFNVNVGGPVLKDKIWFFTSYEFNRIVLTPTILRNANTGTKEAEPETAIGHFLLGKLTWQLNSSHKLTFQLQTDPTTFENESGDSTVFRTAQTVRHQGGANYSATWDWVLSGSTLLRSQIGFVDSFLNEVPTGGSYTTPSHVNTLGDLTNNSQLYYLDRRQRLVAHTKVTHFLDDLFGSHELGAGLDFMQDKSPYIASVNGDAIYIDSGYQTDGEGNIVFDDDGNPVGNPTSKYEYDGTLRTVTRGSLVGLWLRDEWRPTSNLLLKVGARFDHSEAYNDVGTSVINFNTIAPRLYVSWDPTNDQKTALTAGYGQFYDNGMLLVADFVNKRTFGGRIYDWDGSQYTYAGNFGGGGSGFELKNLRAPVKHEFQLGVERELASNLGVGARLIFSRSQYYFEDDESNLIWNADGSDAIGFKNGVDEYIFSLGTPAFSYRDYRGLEFTLEKAMADGWLVEGSYVLSDATGTNTEPISYFGDNPVQNDILKKGELGYNVGNALKIQTTKELPLGFTVGAAYMFESGYPYDRIYYNTYYQDYYDYRGEPGQFHYEPFQSLDIRGQWQTKFGRNRLSVIADVFNILDSRTVTLRETAYNPELSDDDPNQTFGRPLARQRPLRARIGLRYNF